MSELESAIQSIIANAASTLAKDIAKAVRQSMAALILAGEPPAVAPTQPARRGPGRPKKSRPTSTGKERDKSGRGYKTYTDADLQRVIDTVKVNPGASPSAIQAATGMAPNAFAAAVKKLKSEGSIRVVGKARNTSYVA